ncbi:hypothetical protein ARAM_005051 [Aspergillus rambellii]|uniref:Uncharacterized protein n=1 Tax=Aspergillus rambellii TaxID=308745 RepID=A0A0F8WZC3_9EURO|nr:hypothetical protein ARAM_005051 [Aspergillus rambellii]
MNHHLWSRAAPAESSSRCVACLSTFTSKAASRTISETSKRHLRIGNPAPALYTSVFAAAALPDVQAKGKHRIEWKERIVAVRKQVRELVDEDYQLQQGLPEQGTSSPSWGTFQTRLFNTLSRPIPRNIKRSPRNQPIRSLHTAADIDAETATQDRVLKEVLEKNGLSLEDSKEDFDLAIDGEEVPSWLSHDVIRQKVIRKLALKQLAIRLLLRPAIAHSYGGVLKNYDADSSTPQMNVPDLIFQLDALRRRIRLLKTLKTAYIDDLAKDLRVRRVTDIYQERVKLDKQVRQDTDLYLNGQMSLEELLLRLANNLLQATDPDRTYSLKMMILAFTKTRQNDLGEMVLKTILPYKFPLNSSLIISILTLFRKTKNLKSFDLFLQMLRGEGYPVDMGNLGFFKKKTVNGVEITVPPVHSTNIVFYAALIKACLRFDQPERADAYLLSARAAGCMDDFAILMAYLQFYSIRNDWEKGLQVLRRTLAFIAATTEHPLERVERLVVMMVHLCDSCEKPEVSEAIIEAAVRSGFDWRIAEKQSDVSFQTDPEFLRWHMAQKLSSKQKLAAPVWEKCYSFVNAIGGQLDELTFPESRRWQKLMGTYSEEVLSSVLAGTPAQYRANKMTKSKHFDSPSQTSATARQVDDFQDQQSLVATQQHEITALKGAVAQLKQMVFQLYQTTTTTSPTKNAIASHSSPTDMHELNKQLVPNTSELDGTSAPRSTGFLKS